MRVFTKIARIAVSLPTLLLLSGLVAFGSSPASSYSLDGNGNRTLESIAFDEGRILKSGSSFVADYHIKDHIGSVRAVVRNGNIIEENDYYRYGAKMAKPGLVSQTSPVSNRYLFSSKEDQAVAFGSYGLDFGARDYAHDGLTWFEPDPLASKYYHLSPYTYCAGNPVLYIDPKGKLTDKYYGESGKLILDTKEGDKEFIVKTSKVDRPTTEGNAISQQDAENTEELIRRGNITGEHMDNVIEILPMKTIKKAWQTIGDDGTGRVSTNNAREYGGSVDNTNRITHLRKSSASFAKANHIQLHSDENTKAEFHSHQSLVGQRDMRSSNYPSEADMSNAGERLDYLFIPKDKEVIVYDKYGTHAIFKIE